ncbi:MAG: hypothetical protein JWP81_3436 [Ferruginibacter sp.]|nr:hypothetical protein [Ferruginibacter sp.]
MRRIFIAITTVIFHVLISWNLQGQQPVISSALTVNGTVGVALPNYTITASNLPTSFDATSLPAGLIFNPLTATISGTPFSAGNFNANISASNVSGSNNKILVFTITPGSQQITGLTANDTKIYGAPDYPPGASASSGLPVFYASSNTSVATILNNTIVIVGQGTCTITASQPGNADYNAAPNISQNLTVNKKMLSVTGTSIATKMYDGLTTTGVVTVGAISGFASSEILSITANGLYADANAGSGKTTTVNYILANGANGGRAANYSLADEILTGTIVPKTVSITGTAINPKVYDGSATTGGIIPGNIDGLVSNETLTVLAAGLYADANAGINKNATVSYSLSDGTNGGVASNYSLPGEIIQGTISPKILSITRTIINPKVYDGSTTTGGIIPGNIDGLVSNETLTITATGLYVDAKAGINKSAAVNYLLLDGINGGLASNYSLPGEILMGTIDKKALAISGTIIQSKAYDGNAATGTIGIGNIGGLVANETLIVTANGLFTNANTGIDKIAPIAYTMANGTNGGLATNYTLVNDTLKGSITPKQLSISGTTIAPKVYDGSALTGTITTGTISGFIGEETVTVKASGLYTDANAGIGKTATIHYTLEDGINGGLASNYSLPDELITGNVTPAPLTIKVLVDTVKCSRDAITFDKTKFAVTGLVQNEKIASLTLSPAGSPANDPAGVGIHSHFIGANSPIGVGTTSPTKFIAGNYSIAVDSGKLTINKTPTLVMQTDTICSNGTFVISPTNTNGNDFAAGTTYSWAAPSGTGFNGGAPGSNRNSISGTLSNTSGNNIVRATYRVVPLTGNCIGDTFTVLIVIRHLPSRPQIAMMPATLQLCQRSSQNFSASIANSYSNTSTVNDVLFTWTTNANLIATNSPQQSKGKNAVVQFPGAGPYQIKVIDSVLERNGCVNDTTITIGPLGAAGATPNTIIYNGIDFVCLNNNVNPAIDGYQWGYDTKALLSNNYTTGDAPFVTAQNLTRPISDTATRYVWVLTRSGTCFTKTYFNQPHGRAGTIQPLPMPSGSSINIYPNPVNDRAIITWRYTYATDAAIITITDVAGRRVNSMSMTSNVTPGRAVLNLSGLPGGMYLVNIRLNNKPAAVGKLVKK